MKNIKILLLVLLFLIVSSASFAVELTPEEMGYMSLNDYGYYIGILGIISGFAFVMGLKQ